MQKKNSRYQTLMHELQKDIVSGLLAPGERLPSERLLAERLGVHRSTIARALNGLVDQGLLYRQVGSGTYVTDNKWGIEMPESMTWPTALSRSALPDTRYTREVARRLTQDPLAPWQHLEDGDAPTDWLPQGEAALLSWDTLFTEAAEGGPLGLLSLREAVAAYLARHYGMHVDHREILITSGTQQTLFLLTHGFLQPGDAVAVESPSYFYTLSLFQAAGLKLIPIPLEHQGPSLEALEQAARNHNLRMLFLNPIFQNPTGISIQPDHRAAIMDLCSRYHIPIFEDDASAMLPYQGRFDNRPMKAWDFHQQILYGGSISKYMGPSVRLGWLVGPARLMSALADLRHAMDAGLSVLPQIIVRDYLNHQIDEQILFLKEKLEHPLGALTRFMHQTFPMLSPLAIQGGFYLYYRFNKNVDQYTDVLQQLLDHHLIVQEGSYFGDTQPAIRLNITRYAKERQQ